MHWTISCTLSLLLAVSAVASPAFSQGAPAPPDPEAPRGEDLTTPADWRIRLDKPDSEVVVGDDDSADIFFVSMVPGWHITTGPRAIFWHPGLAAEGTWRAESTIFFFDPGERNEAYGIFFGGQDLEGDAIAYDYFVLRNGAAGSGGQYLIKRRRGTETEVIHDWTAHEAIATFGPESEDSVKNVLAVEVGEESVRFSVNGTQVATVPRAEVSTDGHVGLRINHHVNVHVSDVSVTPAD